MLMFFLSSICASEANFKIICFSGGMTIMSANEKIVLVVVVGLVCFAQSLLGSCVPNKALFLHLLLSHDSSSLFLPWQERS